MYNNLMKSLKQTYLISAPIDKVWQALVDPEIIQKWGAGPAKMSENKNFEFSLWGGEIHGKNIEVSSMKKLVQQWYGGDWKEPSIVTFKLANKNNKTELLLSHTNIPDEEFKDIEQGWIDYYMTPLKDLVEKN